MYYFAQFGKHSFTTEIVFLVATAGISFLAGFGLTLSRAKKAASQDFAQQPGDNARLTQPQIESLQKQVRLHQEATKLAIKALGRGTLYAVSGVAVFSLIIWKMLDVKDFQQFRAKVGSLLPRISSPEANVGRRDFASLTDLLQYIIDEDDKVKSSKK